MFFFMAGASGVTISKNPVIDGRLANCFPDILVTTAANGLTRHKKLFALLPHRADIIRIFVSVPSGGDSDIFLLPASLTDSEEDAQEYTAWKGAGLLVDALSSGLLTSVVVQCKSATGFQANDLIHIGQGGDYARVQSVSWSGTVATLTIAPLNFIAEEHAADTVISACVECGNAGIQPFWVKEIIPAGSRPQWHNSTRISVYSA